MELQAIRAKPAQKANQLVIKESSVQETIRLLQNDNSVSNSQRLDSLPRTTTSRILQFQQMIDRSNVNSVPDNYNLHDQHNTMNFTIDMNDDIINQYSQLFEVKSIRFLWEPYKGTYW